jgi:hypothetical protein
MIQAMNVSIPKKMFSGWNILEVGSSASKMGNYLQGMNRLKVWSMDGAALRVNPGLIAVAQAPATLKVGLKMMKIDMMQRMTGKQLLTCCTSRAHCIKLRVIVKDHQIKFSTLKGRMPLRRSQMWFIIQMFRVLS